MMHTNRIPFAQLQRLILPERYLLTRTHDRIQANKIITELYGSYRSDRPAGARELGPVCLHTAYWGELSLSMVNYGGFINIEPHDLGSGLIVTTVLEGHIRIVTAGQSYSVAAGASVLTVDEDHSRFEYEEGATALKLRLSRQRLEALCWKIIGAQGRQPLRFRVVMDDVRHNYRWLSLLEFLVGTLDRDGDFLCDEHLAPATQELLMMTLLSGQPHNYSAALDGRATSIAPSQWHRAVAYMEHHIGDALTLADIAHSSGCSIRSLTRTFREFKGTTAMRYLIDMRLDRVRSQLLQEVPSSSTIESIAEQWGFTHLGTFYQQYKGRFGESPAQSRKRPA